MEAGQVQGEIVNYVFDSRIDPLLRTHDGRDCTAAEPAECVGEDKSRLRFPRGAASNMADIPQILWSAGLTPAGPWMRASLFHDGGYRNTLLRMLAGADMAVWRKARELRQQAEALMDQADALEASSWAPANLNKPQSDDLILGLMIADGVPIPIREAIYEGVKLGGVRAFRDDRAT